MGCIHVPLFTVRRFAELNPGIGETRLRNWLNDEEKRVAMIRAGALLRMGHRWIIDDERLAEFLRNEAAKEVG